MIAAIKLPHREPVNTGIVLSILFHVLVAAALLYLVHPHFIFPNPAPRHFPGQVLFPPPAPPPPVVKPKVVDPPPEAPLRHDVLRQQAPPVIATTADVPSAPVVADAAPHPVQPAPVSAVVGTVVPASYYSAVQGMIRQSLNYPAVAVANDEEGACQARVSFGRDGVISAVQVEKSAGYPALDRECGEVFRRIGRFPAIPADAEPGASSFQIELSVNFSLD